MPALNNHRRELFTQLLFQGFSTVDAYEKAGYKRHDGNASTLANHPEVQARLEEIRGEPEKIRGERTAESGVLPSGTRAIAARANVTAESLIVKAEEVYKCAMDHKQLSAANGSIREMGVLAGVRVERAEVGGPGEFEAMEDAELMASIRERFARLNDETQPDAGGDTTRH